MAAGKTKGDKRSMAPKPRKKRQEKRCAAARHFRIALYCARAFSHAHTATRALHAHARTHTRARTLHAALRARALFRRVE